MSVSQSSSSQENQSILASLHEVDFFNAVNKTQVIVDFNNVLDCGTGQSVALFRVYKVQGLRSLLTREKNIFHIFELMNFILFQLKFIRFVHYVCNSVRLSLHISPEGRRSHIITIPPKSVLSCSQFNTTTQIKSNLFFSSRTQQHAI